MLRLLIGTGVVLMAVGFGAAGWQYWQSLPAASAGAAEAGSADPTTQASAPAPKPQVWLASPSGGLVAPDVAYGYLVQDRYAPARTVLVTRQANLADLLASGEALPQNEYLQVLADIRAPRVAEGLCEVVLQSGAADCAVNAARVVEGSVDPAAGTALFRLELVYRLPVGDEPAPDLGSHVFRSASIALTLDPGTSGTESADAALGAALSTAKDACAEETVGQMCRTLRLSLDWAPGKPVQAVTDIGWLEALPDGVSVAPPLNPAKDG